MFSKRLLFIPVIALTLLVTACEAPPVNRYSLEHASDYWQRSSASSAIYLQGPKAQQTLHKDIAECTVEIRELTRIGALRHAIPASSPANNNTAAGNLADWDTPEHNGALRSEHLPYHDFESCMTYRGWERIKYVPYDVQKRAHNVYRETVLGDQMRTKYDQNDTEDSSSNDNYKVNE